MITSSARQNANNDRSNVLPAYLIVVGAMSKLLSFSAETVSVKPWLALDCSSLRLKHAAVKLASHRDSLQSSQYKQEMHVI